MYPKPKYKKTSIDLNQGFEGETIEMRIERIVNNNEPITDGAPKIFTERAEGVVAEYDVRTDKWDRVLDAKDKVDADAYMKRAERIKKYNEERNPKKEGDKPENNSGGDAGGESTQGTTGNQNK